MFNWLYKKIAQFVPAPKIDINSEEVQAAIRAMIAENIPSKNDILEQVCAKADIPDQEQILGYLGERAESNIPHTDKILEHMFSNNDLSSIDLPTNREICEWLLDNEHIDFPSSSDIQEAIVENFDYGDIGIDEESILRYAKRNNLLGLPEVNAHDVVINSDLVLPDTEEITIEAVRQLLNENNIKERIVDRIVSVVIAHFRRLGEDL